MPRKASLKGMTWGSDGFVRIAQYEEKRGEVAEALEQLDKAVGEIIGLLPDMSHKEQMKVGEIIEQLI
ncbi:hypothetical protein [Virgibacillus proomii]|uniref:hypothetical protein n=1 Tax=Virgibacillus proomii TaxID=84407 RepID=UPI001C0F7FA4|nr:hypothetical protein [Virgibacillus proomii]MBU5266234.1 hypothetical protein [Virgibacillus proomii]